MVRNKTVSARLAEALLLLVMVLISIVSLAPVLHTFSVSFSDNAAAAGGFVKFWPVGFNVESYRRIMEEPHFLNSFFVSVKRVLVGGAINFALTILMAYPLSRSSKEFPHRNVYMWFMLFTMLFSGGIIPLYLTVKGLGLFNTIWALVLPGAVPVFNVILLMNFFRNMPKELSDAGYMDGAGPWYMMVKVFVPLSLPSLATVTLFSIVGHWNAFFDGMIFMRSAENYPLQTYIQQLVVNLNIVELDSSQAELLMKVSDKTLNAAKIVVSMVPILVVYPFLQKYFIHGIMLGSVKE
ncbi:carbohydrate ABC transporter permease [Paenibacillus doosanensis]|uniref:Trehalose transport system permease protein SugB n=1 Tax=Paenibacillus konkukensis TaxID=2020716 RepID=A0ABY4RM31_9BACL|nr:MULTISPECIES: carbohydrate ABC transporter permease [Paenibacillus]MCS7462105.1 carbohydrate ABC transporter permease [Paenibacillus doosanensis]UQZ83514.1 Trehalose transport system permease protein SugB [Paenibacillus konkukensis]